MWCGLRPVTSQHQSVEPGRAPPTPLAQMGAPPAVGRPAARQPLAGRRGRQRARLLQAALAVAALGGLGVLWVTSGRGAIHAAGWYTAGARPHGGSSQRLPSPRSGATAATEGRIEPVSAVDDVTRSLPGDELGDEDVLGVDLSSDPPDAAETGGAEPGEPAEGERAQQSTLARPGGGGVRKGRAVAARRRRRPRTAGGRVRPAQRHPRGAGKKGRRGGRRRGAPPPGGGARRARRQIKTRARSQSRTGSTKGANERRVPTCTASSTR